MGSLCSTNTFSSNNTAINADGGMKALRKDVDEAAMEAIQNGINASASSLKQTINLTFALKDLKSTYNAFILLYEHHKHAKILKGRTESSNNQNPTFITSFNIDYYFEE